MNKNSIIHSKNIQNFYTNTNFVQLSCVNREKINTRHLINHERFDMPLLLPIGLKDLILPKHRLRKCLNLTE